jgi:hypothetical protein
MEYVIIDYCEKRTVIIDGDPDGDTGDLLMVEKGTHTFKLDGDQDYTPKWRRVVVKNTTSISPMEVSFEKA